MWLKIMQIVLLKIYGLFLTFNYWFERKSGMHGDLANNL